MYRGHGKIAERASNCEIFEGKSSRYANGGFFHSFSASAVNSGIPIADSP